jgi:ribosome maturation factor RimP
MENRKNYPGKLIAYENNTITLETESNQIKHFPREAIAACRLAVFED